MSCFTLLSSEDVRLVELKGLEAAPAAAARSYFGIPARAVEFCLSMDLPKTPTDKAYELMGNRQALNQFPREFSASTIRAKQDFVCRSSAKEKLRQVCRDS